MEFGSENVYPLYVSAPNKTSCFHVLINTLQDLESSIIGLRLATLIPPELALDVSLVLLYNVIHMDQQLLLNDINPYLSAIPYNNSLYNMELTAVKCNFVFSIIYGLGVRGWGLGDLTMSMSAQVTFSYHYINASDK